MNYRSVSTLNEQIVRWLNKLPNDLDLVVGIPRSGMLVAAILGLHLNLPFTDVDGLIENRIICTGPRYKKNDPITLLKKKRKVLVVDDSLWSGKQMDMVRERVSLANTSHTISYAAVYVTPGSEHKVDMFCEMLSVPRCFEWNIMHHDMLRHSCVDIDGVLCRDPDEVENDDGAGYKYFVKNAEPLIIPSVPVGWLVTCRLEKYRDLTKEWLGKVGVTYGELIMMDFPDKTTRIASNSHASFKAGVYDAKEAALFVESSFNQAVQIANLTGRYVFCTETREMIAPGMLANSLNLANRMTRYFSNRIRSALRRHSWHPRQ